MSEDKNVCHRCIGELYIKKLIKAKGNKESNCSYCEKPLRNISIDELAEKVHEMFDLHYSLTESDYHYDRTGAYANEVIQGELDVDDVISEDIFQSLQENYNDHHGIDRIYDEDYGYEKIKVRRDDFDRKWEEITKSLKEEARFFNHSAKTFLDDLFIDIHTQTTGSSDAVIKTLDTESVLYRARVFNSKDVLLEALSQPERKLGPPRSEDAKAGRMNALGVPVFYGATSPEIAMAEVRPAVGSHVVIARFSPLRNLRILDLSALKSLIHTEGSKFDPENLKKTQKIRFLKTLSYKLTIPVLAEVKGHEYLITQAVSEYLGLSSDYNLDGISFHSTQIEINQAGKRDRSIVLFNKSATVEYGNKSDTIRNYRVTLDDIEYDDGQPIITSDPKIRLLVKGKKGFLSLPSWHPRNRKTSEILKLDVGNLEVHKITGVSYSKESIKLEQGEDIIENGLIDGEIEPKNLDNYSY